jgi:hypothetical protein
MRRRAQQGRMEGEARAVGRHLALIAAVVVILGCQLSLHADVTVRVRLNSRDVTNQTQDWIVGLRATLDVVVARNGTIITPSAWSWTIPGYAIKGYAPTTTKAAVNPLDSSVLQRKTAPIYWVDAGNGRVVSCTVTVDGVQYSAHTTFNVKRPTATVTTSTTSVVIGSSFGDLRMSFGTAGTYGVPGITFTRTCAEPAGFDPGSTQWWQVVDSTSRIYRENGGRRLRRAGTKVLDTALPYDTGASTADSPTMPLTADYLQATASDNFTMYLMYKPAGTPAIWVPLRKVSTASWYWTGDAWRSGANWGLQSSSHSTSPASADCTTPPEWNGNVTGLSWVVLP